MTFTSGHGMMRALEELDLQCQCDLKLRNRNQEEQHIPLAEYIITHRWIIVRYLLQLLQDVSEILFVIAYSRM
jgi:hypothetical protein